MSKRISLDQARHVARLARLDLEEEELHHMHEQLDSILDYMAALEALDVTDVEPTFHVLDMAARLREDDVEPFPNRDLLLSAAPSIEEGGFAVPKVKGVGG